MKTPEDGDRPDTGLGQKIAKTPPKDDDTRYWKALADHPGYQRHQISGEVRETPKV